MADDEVAMDAGLLGAWDTVGDATMREAIRTLWASSGDAMAVSDPDGLVLLTNPAYHELYGYAPGEVIGRSFAGDLPRVRARAGGGRVPRRRSGGRCTAPPSSRSSGVAMAPPGSLRPATRSSRAASVGRGCSPSCATSPSASAWRRHSARRSRRWRPSTAPGSRWRRSSTSRTLVQIGHRRRDHADRGGLRGLLLQRARRARRGVYPVHARGRPRRGVRRLPHAAQHRHLRPHVPRRGRHPPRRRHRRSALRPQRALRGDAARAPAGPQSYLAAPVASRSGEVLGGLFFGHPDPGVFTARHERLVVGLAAQAAMAIDNARLVEAVREAVRVREGFLAIAAHELRTPLTTLKGTVQLVARQLRAARLRPRPRPGAIGGTGGADRSPHDPRRRHPRRVAARAGAVGAAPGAPGPGGARPRGARALRRGPGTHRGARPRPRRGRAAVARRRSRPPGAGRDEPRLQRAQILARRRRGPLHHSAGGGPGDPGGARPRARHRAGGARPTLRTLRPRGLRSGPSAGIGLGLYITRELVARHGGTIVLDSTPGAGTTVTVDLPLAATTAV